MPRVTIWIREADYDKWQAIDNKPEWLADHLNPVIIETRELRIEAPARNGKLIGIDPTITPPEETA